MKNIGVIPNLLKDSELSMTKIVVDWLQEHQFNVALTSHIATLLQDDLQGVDETQLYQSCDAIIAIGGDGTILGVAQKASVYNVPIIGVNLGRLGFLADIDATSVIPLLEKILKEEYTIEERMMLKLKVIDPKGEESIFYALNDVNITRGSYSRITEFEIKVNDNLLDIYPADGIIVATPTGSTAYSLSAGGPIIMPHTQNILITPICPHTIYSRSVIVSDKDYITIHTNNYDGTQMELGVDGQMKMVINPNHFIHIEKASYTTKLIKLSELHFFDILRKKLVERRN